MIHPTAQIAQGAKIADGVQIGPFCQVADGVTLESAVILEAHVTLEAGVHLGKHTHLYPFVHLGNSHNSVMIHEGCTIREFTEIGTHVEDRDPIIIHPHCYIMAYVTMRSGVQVHEYCIITNNVYLGENCTCQSRVIVAAKAHIAKKCTLGAGSMIGGVSAVTHDIPPYCLVEGAPCATIRGLNLVGMRRNFEDRHSISRVKKAFISLKKSDFSRSLAQKMLFTVEDMHARQFVAFVAAHRILP